MASPMQQQLAQSLAGCLHADQQAERQLTEASKAPGFALGLLQLLSSPAAVEAPLRHVAAVVLKNFIKSHWHESARCFEPPVMADEEKQVCVMHSQSARS
jgi:hypothetical protein